MNFRSTIFVTMAIFAAISSTALADIHFSKDGTAYITTEANGVQLTGNEAAALYNALKVKAQANGDGSFVKIVHLDGHRPSTDSFLVCETKLRPKTTECYLGKLK